MALNVDYHPHGCSGSFAERVSLPPLVRGRFDLRTPLGIVLLAVSVAVFVIAWAMGFPFKASLTIVIVSLFVVGSSLQTSTLQEAVVVSTFDVAGPWLEVHHGEGADRVYLPDAEVVLSDHTIHVRCPLSGADAVIIGAPEDEDALQLLVAALTQVEAPSQGDQSEVPPALRRITERDH